MFEFNGNVLVSKSWFNRVLVIQHFNSDIVLEANSSANDVLYLERALKSIVHSNEFDLGMGGTSFRFFVFLISRLSGVWTLRAHERLLERPQLEVSSILNQLGIKTEFTNNGIQIQSKGWSPTEKIICSAAISSQYASGLLLSCWGLEFDLIVEIKKPIISFAYLQMTIELLKEAGMNLIIEETENSINYMIPKNQKTQVKNLKAELDMSSAFALISAAAVNGNINITNWDNKSRQPDAVFLKIFKIMQISFKEQKNLFSIAKQEKWRALDYNLQNSPDLFPVLAVLCALAEGVSTLSGGTQLKYKESNRIKKTKELLDLIHVRSEVLPDGLRIYGQSSTQNISTLLNFNPDHDHRMAMAAALLILKGYNIQISNPEVVNKSYPLFWHDIGLKI